MSSVRDPRERVKEYFDKESSEYCAYFDASAKLSSVTRRVSRRLFQSAIQGRREAVIALCPQPLEGVKICEVGSGGGHYSIELARRGASVLGLDIAPKMVAHATQWASREGVASRCWFREADIFEFETGEKFDVVFAAGVIDYIPPTHQREFIAKLAGMSKRYVIVSFPKMFHYHALFRTIWLGLKGVPVWFFTSRHMTQLLESASTVPDKIIDVGILNVIRARVGESGGGRVD
jgi:2-polyprenyl-3-methyl-5-hydroxy-6-metoxy-1,4-benzoquinol methylase